MKTYSLCDSNRVPLDIKLDTLFEFKTNGVYIELGAFDGLTQSNTAFFEFNRKWTGILIEPSIKSYELCCNNRPNSLCLNMACVSDDYNGNTIKGDFVHNLMASVDGNRLKSNNIVNVNCNTLHNIIQTYMPNKKIDLLSLDTEGYELNILKGLNLDINRPSYLLIEVYNKDYDAVVEYLEINNYKLHSNYSNYNIIDNPSWDGTHNDYLFYNINEYK